MLHSHACDRFKDTWFTAVRFKDTAPNNIKDRKGLCICRMHTYWEGIVLEYSVTVDFRL